MSLFLAWCCSQRNLNSCTTWIDIFMVFIFRSSLSNIECLPYFSLGCVMEGLNQLFQCLFGVSLQHVEIEPGEAWTDDIYKLVKKQIVISFTTASIFCCALHIYPWQGIRNLWPTDCNHPNTKSSGTLTH